MTHQRDWCRIATYRLREIRELEDQLERANSRLAQAIKQRDDAKADFRNLSFRVAEYLKGHTQ